MTYAPRTPRPAHAALAGALALATACAPCGASAPASMQPGAKPPSQPATTATTSTTATPPPTPTSALDRELADLAALVRQAADPATPAPKRRELLDQIDRTRAELVSLHPDDPRAPVWTADRAAAALDGAASLSADLAVIFGVPTNAQRALVIDRAKVGLELAQTAEAAAARIVAGLETSIVSGGEHDVRRVDDDLRRLVEVEQSRRIPYLKALARLLLGACEREAATRGELCQQAALEFRKIDATTGPLASARLVGLGAALLHAGLANAAGARSGDVLKVAGEQFEQALRTPQAPSSKVTWARLGLIRLNRPAVTTTNDVPELDEALVAEARAAGAMDAARPGGEGAQARPQALRTAARELSRLVETASLDDPRAAIVLEKLDALAPGDARPDDLPPWCAFARAVAQARSADATPAALSESARTLDALTRREGASASLNLAALWERAAIMGRPQATGSGGPLELDALLSVVDADPTGERGLRAMRRAAAVVGERLRTLGPGQSLPGGWGPRLPAARSMLTTLVQREPTPTRRMELVRLSLYELGAPDTELSPAIEQASRVLGFIGSAESDATTRTMLIDGVWSALEARRAEAVTREGLATEQEFWRWLLPAARAGLEFAKLYDQRREVAYSVVLGECLVGAGDARALEVLGPLSGSAVDHPGSTLWARFRLALASAQVLSDKKTQAFGTLRDLAESIEAKPGERPGDAAYWQAWARMLEILASQNADGSRTQDIAAQIARLELVDPALGSAATAERIRAVKASPTRAAR